MRFLMNYQNLPNDESFDDSDLLLLKYATLFYKTFKKKIQFIQILFPSYKHHYVTIILSVFLYIFFFGYDIYFFNKYNPLFIRDDVITRIGINRDIITTEYHFHKLITATLIHPNIWSLIINTYYLINLGIVVEKNYGRVHTIALMLFSSICGNLLMCATANCNESQLGTSTILSGMMGLFLQEVTSNFRRISGKIEIIGTYLFTIISMYLTISMFPHNGNIMGNLGGLFGGYCYPYIFNVARLDNGPGNTERLVHTALMGLYWILLILNLLFVKC
ncbi:rhomboid protease ROM10, putative [Plasmodium chabaudi chabaudi]|uniref:Rhomboid protease ROM10, putative n=1 Tax=Plasmodium chabaudi chabaudi TaxID=31271 RepID=A0A1C6YJU2_PLACU|nr:rhomboid protease ROM10, putative [Plasmodium chabaudi chabaudi]SCN61101.1 rhomboid protease ROM10, putative [Plasmodium chabaudi chabaudi]